MKIELYPYQEKVLECIEADPCHSKLISMPTGTGKTITFLAAIKQLNKKCLILVHRQELLDQTYEKALHLGFSKEDISTISSSEKGEIKKLTISMVPTLIRNLDLYRPDEIEMVVVDEAHHVLARSYMSILHHFKVFEEKKILLGFTATPLRGDQKCLSNVFESHTFKMTLSEATRQGYICPVHGLRIEMKKSLAEVEQKQGDYDTKQLDKIMNCPEINDLIASRCEFLQKTPGIIFCTSVEHARHVAQALRSKGRRAISISYKTKKKTLEKIFAWLKMGRVEFITNAIKLSEGFDFPAIETVILARPTRSPVLYKQMIGRGLRKNEGKHDCLIMEFSGNDEKMIRWEDIDENATFQCIDPEVKISQDQAKRKYESTFKSPLINILDVRVSPFSYYECFVRRIKKYKKKFLFCPDREGFAVGRFEPLQTLSGVKVYNLYVWHNLWEEEYKSFYVYSHDNFYYSENGWDNKMLIEMFKTFCKKVRPHGGLGKWYPSEQEPMTAKQKKVLNSKNNYSARKAEWLIEDHVIMKAINEYFLDGHFSGRGKIT